MATYNCAKCTRIAETWVEEHELGLHDGDVRF